MKGHHTAQLAILFNKATFEIRTPAAGVIQDSSGNQVVLAGLPVLRVSAIMCSEPELRFGPGTQFVRYATSLPSSATKHVVDNLGQTSSLQGVEEGAGIAMLLWLSKNRGLGGAWADGTKLEYVNFPIRGLDQMTDIRPFMTDWLGASGSSNAVPHARALVSADATFPIPTPSNMCPGGIGPWQDNGCLYSPGYDGRAIGGDAGGLRMANFLPLISPKRFLEVSKLQSIQGTVDLHCKHNGAWPGTEDVFFALQYHSWTPAQVDAVFTEIIKSGLAQTVWGTNDLVPSVKIANKQPAGGINPSKTRYFAHTWAPREAQPNPPSTSAKA
jgi:hypothetical protein